MFESMASPGFLLAPSESPLSEAYIHHHCATQPRNIVALILYKFIILKPFFSAVNAVWSWWSCIYHEFKDTSGEN